ncbi:hypothetical protein JI75_06495 [Berryella intestinalis]|uniref:Uncharacterized protein n=1 Tax=Berryella intestinalis TaxID=1531429 RepID=A0A0A8B694_9ACTN|nr:DmsC/YnfH family molybdoenzyme membrane anchor subunit [Berryella intestinalis]AJC12353.1 hypothetical protein JI75_06495 [Berryella intestinalis]
METQWSLLLFAVFGGMGMGILTYVSIHVLARMESTLNDKGVIASLALLFVGGACSSSHMGHPDKALYVLSNLESGISQELIATAIATCASLALLYTLKKKGSSESTRRIVASFALVTSLALPAIMGHAYLMEARPALNTWALPFLFLCNALAMGASAAALLARVFQSGADELRRSHLWALAGIAAFACSVVVWLSAVGVAYEPDYSRSVARIATGDLAPLFWGGVVIAGMVVPFGAHCAAKPDSHATAGLGAAALGLTGIFIGSVTVRIVMYAIATSVQSFIY